MDPIVSTDGFSAYFTIRSDFGVFEALSPEEALIRIHEVYAIAALDEMKRHEVATEGVVAGVRQPFLAMKSFATEPGQTVQNVGESVGRWLGRGRLTLRKWGKRAGAAVENARDSYARRQADQQAGQLAEQEVRERALAEGRDPDAAVSAYRQRVEDDRATSAEAEADAVRDQERSQAVARQIKKASFKHLGYDKARRRLAQSLSVDPYTTNIPLQERLDAMAWALWVGRFATDMALPSNDLVDRVQGINDLVWAYHPKDLEVRERKDMKAMGVEPSTMDAFFENPVYTVSDRTSIVLDLMSMHGTGNRAHFVREATAADNRPLALYFRRSARMLALAHEQHALEQIVSSSERLVAAQRQDGSVLWFLAVVHLAWTENLDLIVGGVSRQLQIDGGPSNAILHIAGGLTAKAKQGIETHGWIVNGNILARHE